MTNKHLRPIGREHNGECPKCHGQNLKTERNLGDMSIKKCLDCECDKKDDTVEEMVWRICRGTATEAKNRIVKEFAEILKTKDAEILTLKRVVSKQLGKIKTLTKEVKLQQEANRIIS